MRFLTEFINPIMINIISSAISYCICKWLDRYFINKNLKLF